MECERRKNCEEVNVGLIRIAALLFGPKRNGCDIYGDRRSMDSRIG